MTIRQIGSRVWLLSAPDISIAFDNSRDAFYAAAAISPDILPEAVFGDDAFPEDEE